MLEMFHKLLNLDGFPISFYFFFKLARAERLVKVNILVLAFFFFVVGV